MTRRSDNKLRMTGIYTWMLVTSLIANNKVNNDKLAIGDKTEGESNERVDDDKVTN